ncbi:elafin [Saccopteryx bilineata]|uniref:elafin n=1 Tax=Saccopteryx bilineata TaxID=59482 RepID=UPI00339025AA
MRTSSFLVLAVFVVLGTLAVQAAVTEAAYKGQEAVKGQSPFKDQQPVKGQRPVKIPSPQRDTRKSGSCPQVLIRCAMMNPPNACRSDSECPGARKCCQGPCGLACLNPQ